MTPIVVFCPTIGVKNDPKWLRYKLSLKHLHLCSSQQQIVYRFLTTGGWTNDDIFYLIWFKVTKQLLQFRCKRVSDLKWIQFEDWIKFPNLNHIVALLAKRFMSKAWKSMSWKLYFHSCHGLYSLLKDTSKFTSQDIFRSNPGCNSFGELCWSWTHAGSFL